MYYVVAIVRIIYNRFFLLNNINFLYIISFMRFIFNTLTYLPYIWYNYHWNNGKIKQITLGTYGVIEFSEKNINKNIYKDKPTLTKY